MKEKMIVIDGNSLLFRAFYATYNPYTPIMRTKDGIPTNALFAFSNMINKIVSEFKYNEHIIVVFDTGHKTFRHQELDTYKANRKPLPEDLRIQMPLAREFLHAMGIYTCELEGYEGDDVAGSVAKKASKEGFKVHLYTSDRDFLQLIDDNIDVFILKKGLSDIAIMDKSALLSEYELLPEQIPDFKGLMGDSSDNLKGIPGVGKKTAVKLIKEYGNLDNIIEASSKLKGKVYENIIEYQDQGRLCRHLAEIKTDLALPFSLSDTLYTGHDFQKLSSFCNKYELKQLLNKLNYSRANKKAMKDTVNYEIVNKCPMSSFDEISIALDMSDINYNYADIYGIAYHIEGKTYYEKIDDLLKDTAFIDAIQSKKVKKYACDYKAIKVALKRFNILIDGLYFDLLIASYLLDSSLSNNINSIMNFYGKELSQNENSNLLFVDGNSLKYAEIAYYIYSLYDEVIKSLKNADALELFDKIELPLVDVLCDMELEGFPLHKDDLYSMGETFKEKLDSISKEIYSLAGMEFNISSPKQVGEVLFDKLGIKSPTKKMSTSVEVLNKIKNQNPIVDKILNYRKYSKLLSTYVDGLATYIHDDGKLHPIYNQALTTTGRLSSSEPNIQNISIRDEESKLIRKAFYYDDENIEILSFDYSQVELRILASLSGCQKLIDAFNNDEDIHTLTAKHIFHKDEVSDNERRKAKAVNFGIVYGISDWGLAEQLEISTFEARDIIKVFYETYPEILSFMKNIADDAEKNGYAKTILGRVRYIREFHDSNYQVREFARRAAINAPIQGSAADIIKIAMVNISRLLKEGNYKTKMVCQIHDELIFKVPREEMEVVSTLIAEQMENAYPMRCRLKVEGTHGRTWYEAK